MTSQIITIYTEINAPVDKVWTLYTKPEHIVKWNNATDEWHTTSAENDLRIGGKFLSRMEAKDGSAGFDFEGTYDDVIDHQKISYTMTDGRKATIKFEKIDDLTRITITC